MTELKPCPFCGGEAYVAYNDSDCTWIVRCFHCRAEVAEHMCFDYGENSMKATREYVVDKWNQREGDT